MIIDIEALLRQVAALPPQEQLALGEKYWQAGRAIFAQHAEQVVDIDRKIERLQIQRRVRAEWLTIWRQVEKEIAAGVELETAAARIAAQQAAGGACYDTISVTHVWRTERRRRQRRRSAVRDRRIIAAVCVRQRSPKIVAAWHRVTHATVTRIVRGHLERHGGDVCAALEQLHEDIKWYRGRPIEKPPVPAATSPLADEDARARDDELIAAEIGRWRALAAEARVLGRRCRSRPRINAEAITCLRRGLAAAAMGYLGLLEKLRAADQLRVHRLQLRLALAALAAARADAEQIAARSAPIDTLIAGEAAAFRDLWSKASAVGRRNLVRPLLKRQAWAALSRVIEAPSAGAGGIAAKLKLLEELAEVKPFRKIRWRILAGAIADAERLAGVAANGVRQTSARAAKAAHVRLLPGKEESGIDDRGIGNGSVLKTQPTAPADAIADRCIVDAFNDWWRDAQEACGRLDIEEAGGASAAFVGQTDAIARRCQDLMLLAIETPAMTVSGVCAKLQAAGATMELGLHNEGSALIRAAIVDAGRLAGGLELHMWAWKKRQKAADRANAPC